MATSCWNSIGVRGDGSCAELARHVHCRNCSVYANAAHALLDRNLTATHTAEWTRHLAAPKTAAAQDVRSVFVFRVEEEWLGLPIGVLDSVLDTRPIHSIPHRRSGAVVGVANVRGELLACISLQRLLGIQHDERQSADPARAVHRRLLVIRRLGLRVVCGADEVHGVHRYDSQQVSELPATIGRAAIKHSAGILQWQGRSVGVLDEKALFETVQRSMS